MIWHRDTTGRDFGLHNLTKALAVVALGTLLAADVLAEDRFATVEVAIPGRDATRAVRIDAAAFPPVEAELKQLPPSKQGFPAWLVHVYDGVERERSFAVFPEDLAANPGIARVVGQLKEGQNQYVYRLELPGTYSPRSEEVVSRLAQANLSPLLHDGEHSNWPYVEVLMTESTTGAGPAPAAAPADEAEARAAFFDRVKGVVTDKTKNKALDVPFRRINERLYQHQRAFTTDGEIKQFRSAFRRFTYRGAENKSKLSILARYAAPTEAMLDRVASIVTGGGDPLRSRVAPKRYKIEVLVPEARAEDVRTRVAAVFPDLIAVKPGRE